MNKKGTLVRIYQEKPAMKYVPLYWSHRVVESREVIKKTINASKILLLDIEYVSCLIDAWFILEKLLVQNLFSYLILECIWLNAWLNSNSGTALSVHIAFVPRINRVWRKEEACTSKVLLMFLEGWLVLHWICLYSRTKRKLIIVNNNKNKNKNWYFWNLGGKAKKKIDFHIDWYIYLCTHALVFGRLCILCLII